MFPNQFQKFTPYQPKRPIKSFQDLEVYQKALEASVFAGKNIGCSAAEATGALSANPKGTKDAISAGTSVKNEGNIWVGTNEFILKNMTACALSIPHLIAEAHSMRFGSSDQCLLVLDKVMLNCNKMVVYLEQARDICATGLEADQFADQIKKYFFIRRKVLNLQRVWRKYIQINKQENSPR